MPILPENKNRYPKNWKQIRKSILDRAQHKCENCGLENYVKGIRCQDGVFEPLYIGPRQLLPDECDRVIRIILTIAHLDHTPENCSHENLKALCQQCHNRYDSKHRAETRKIRRKLIHAQSANDKGIK